VNQLLEASSHASECSRSIGSWPRLIGFQSAQQTYAFTGFGRGTHSEIRLGTPKAAAETRARARTCNVRSSPPGGRKGCSRGSIQHAVPVPQVDVLPDPVLRGGRSFGQRLPLAARPEHVEDDIQDLANVHRPRATPRFAGRSAVRSAAFIRSLCSAARDGPRHTMLRLPHEAPPTQVPPWNHDRFIRLNFFPGGPPSRGLLSSGAE
jgi:hypothetical protein